MATAWSWPSDPVFVTCPAAFQDPVFRAPTPDEVRLIVQQVGEAPPVLIALEVLTKALDVSVGDEAGSEADEGFVDVVAPATMSG